MQRRRFILGASLVGVNSLLPAADRAAALRVEERRHREKRWAVCRVDPVVHALDLFLSGADGKPLRNFQALDALVASRGRRVVVAMNAGMFELDGSPVGWCVVGGKTLKEPNLADGAGNFFLKPNGVLAIENGKPGILETKAAVTILKGPAWVTQSGPLLVISGKVHPGFKADSTNRRIRNAVGVTAEGGVWLAISEDEVTFHESATFFRDDLDCPDALFLDGVVSQLYAPASGRKAGPALLGPLLAVTVPV